MRAQLSRWWLLFCLLAAVGTAAAADDKDKDFVPVSIMQNPRFTELDEKGAPRHWGLTDAITLEKEGDMNFLRLKVIAPKKDFLVYRRVYLPNPRPQALEIRLKARWNDIKKGEKPWNDGRIILHYKNNADKQIGGDPTTRTFSGTSKGWEDISYFIPVPQGADYLEVMPFLMQAASGTLDFALFDVLTAPKSKLPIPHSENPLKPSPVMTPKDLTGMPPALRVKGNKIFNDKGQEVWLQGLCLDSMEWSGGGEHILESVKVAIDDWKANCIRLPITDEFWAGRNKWQRDDGMGYRKLVDDAIAATVSRGAYLIIDLHRFHAPTVTHVEFWKDVATRYKNHPGVIFELFNEPHGLSWKVWRDGGSLSGKENKSNDKGLAENDAKADKDYCVGMQALIDAVRGAGADNPVIAGGLDWSYDLSGVSSGEYVLKDPKGRGIIYSSHIYPWKKGWQHAFVDALDKYPVFIGETGNIRAWEDFSFIPVSARTEKVGVGSQWPIDMLGLIQSRKIHWTGFSFHPKCGPQVLKDWSYTPTDFWGVHVKDALAGKKFEMKSMR